jgi:glutathione S-transferase
MLFSLRGTLPVLDIDGERIVDTTGIIEALERRFPDPPLYPAEPQERRRALELEEFFEEEAGHEMRRAVFIEWFGDPGYVAAAVTTAHGGLARRAYDVLLRIPGSTAYAKRRYRINPRDSEEGRAKVAAALDRIAAELQPSGYLVGSGFSVADLAASALLFPLAWPAELQYDYPEPPPSPFIESLRAHPAVDWIREMYGRHRGESSEVRA